MSATISNTNGVRTPFLDGSSSSVARDHKTVAISSDDHDKSSSVTPPDKLNEPKQRLVSLDVFRGLSIALMILVDHGENYFTSLSHSAWFGVSLSDFVMPFFLFGVGISVALVFKRVPSKLGATKKVIPRTLKLFLLGLILQGGYIHGRNSLSFGVDVSKIRWMGVLQRISIGYFLTSMTEIWLVDSTALVDSGVAFAKKYYKQWVVVLLIGLLHTSLLYGLYVPSWTFQVPSLNATSDGSITLFVKCEVRGSLEPPCNAAGFIDRLFLGEQHLFSYPVYRRTKECTVNSPDSGPLPPNVPSWCLAPFDPEGLLSSLMAAITCFMGLHYGHIMVHVQGHKLRVISWSVCSLTMLISGQLLNVLGVPLCKSLYTLSYLCITTGASGLVLTIIYFIVDVKGVKKPMKLLEWMGINALIIYILATCDIFAEAVNGFYWHSPENNLINATQGLFQFILHSKKFGSLAFIMLEILFWCLLAGFLHKKQIYIKL